MFKKQLEAFEKFSKLKIGALFMQMGTGKTRIALDLVKYNHVDLLVYVAPFSSLNNIDAEFKKWSINCEYILIGYETIQSSSTKYLELLSKMESKKCFVIADESIFIKNEDTKRYNRLLRIRKNCEYALILNGTPLTKNEWDLYNQMEFLSPLILKMSRNEFLNTFFKKVTYKRKHEKEKSFYQFSEINAEQLNKMVEPYIFVADLEFEHNENNVYFYIPYTEQEYHIEKQNRLRDMEEIGIDPTSIISMLTSLNIIASKYKEKNDRIIEYIKGKQVIVYCNFLDEIKYISNYVDCFVITGDTKNRKDVIEMFKRDKKPLIMTYGVGSYSLNLQFCNEIVYSSLNFDFGKIEQSKYRIKRIGQTSDIKYTYFLTDVRINRMILDNLGKKANLKQLIEEKMKGDYEWVKYL